MFNDKTRSFGIALNRADARSRRPNDCANIPRRGIIPVGRSGKRGIDLASYTKDIDKIRARLKRIEGQVRGVQRMVDEEKYCIDILTQLSSIIAATEKVGLMVLRDHIHGCVRDSLSGKDADERIDELIGTIERFMKT